MPLEFNGLDAGDIKHDPEVETLLVTGDNRTEVRDRLLNWLTETSPEAPPQKAGVILHPVEDGAPGVRSLAPPGAVDMS